MHYGRNIIAFLVALVLLSQLAQYLSGKESSSQQSFEFESNTIDIVTIATGYSSLSNVETWLKSIFFFHNGHIHFHFIGDNKSCEVITTLLDTWRVSHVNYTIYPIYAALETAGLDEVENSEGILKLLLHDILPETVQRVIYMDAYLMILNDVGELYGLFGKMNKQEVIAVTPVLRATQIETSLTNTTDYDEDMTPRISSSVMLIKLDSLRQTNWNNLWKKVMRSLIGEMGRLPNGVEDILNTLATSHPHLFNDLPCSYNYRSGPDSMKCTNNVKEVRIVNTQHVGSSPHFRQLHECVQRIDGNLLVGTKATLEPQGNRNIGHHRTHLFINNFNYSKRYYDVTLATWMTVANATYFKELLANWKMPVSAVVLGSDDELPGFKKYIDSLLRNRTNVAVHYVYETDKQICPADRFRNIAVKASSTAFVFLTDPAYTVPQGLESILHQKAHRPRSRSRPYFVPSFKKEFDTRFDLSEGQHWPHTAFSSLRSIFFNRLHPVISRIALSPAIINSRNLRHAYQKAGIPIHIISDVNTLYRELPIWKPAHSLTMPLSQCYEKLLRNVPSAANRWKGQERHDQVKNYIDFGTL